MAANNNITIMGRLTADPELKKTQSGIATVTVTVAVDRAFKDAQGNKQTDFLNVVAWKTKAEFISKYFKKGEQILVQGSVQTRNWTDKDGAKHYATEILADDVSFCGGKKDDASQSSPNAKNDTAKKATAKSLPDVEEMTIDGDLPF
ncbi:MAG: single-stranded DNA-binding protein [Oscillospiraceae bacterium]